MVIAAARSSSHGILTGRRWIFATAAFHEAGGGIFAAAAFHARCRRSRRRRRRRKNRHPAAASSSTSISRYFEDVATSRPSAGSPMDAEACAEL